MTNEDTIKKIKTRGYWRINFEPLVYKEKFNSLPQLKEYVVKNSVKLRGWDYPHIPPIKTDNQNLGFGNKYCEGWIDWQDMIEIWRVYQSGQFLHYLAVREDWAEFNGWGITPNNQNNIIPKEEIDAVGNIVYEFTELFEFLSRLARSGFYDEGVKVSISLHNTKGRKLVIRDPRKFPLREDYISAVDLLEFEKEYSKVDLIYNSKDLALNAIIYFLERFGWENIPIESIKKDQNELLHI